IDADQYITIAEGVGFNQSPVAGAPLSPLSGDSLSGANLRFSWSGAVNPEAEDLTYRIHLWGTGVDTLIQVINDTLLYLPGPALPGPGNYSWRLEVSDGYSLVSGFDIVDFYANPTHENFTSVTGVDISPDSGYSEGVVWSDFNNDGLPDIYVSNLLSQKNLYYVNDGGGFNRVDSLGITARSGDSYGATSGDFNGDGLPDLFVIHGLSNQDQNNQLFLNDGAGGFTEVSATPIVSDGGRSWSCSAIDFDRDGFLDIFVANYGQNNALYRNDGGQLVDATAQLDPAVVDDISYEGVFLDADLDGDLDLYVVNDFGNTWPNRVLWNDGTGHFTLDDPSSPSGLVQSMTGMGLGIGDLDGDERPDLAIPQWAKNTLFLSGSGRWVDWAGSVGFEPTSARQQRVGWGTVLGDIDNDGDLDAFTAYGHLWTLNRVWNNPELQADALYVNEPNGDGWRFVDRAQELGTADPHAGRGGALVDLDGDGWLDLVSRHVDGPDDVLMARCGDARWLRVRARMPGTPNTRAIGAKIELYGHGTHQTRWLVGGGTGFASAAPPEAHFGLGQDDGVALRVTWPDGVVSWHDDVATNRIVTLTRDR
ncbi:MAG: CRTAC1 family protein, partial [Myxococcales bacterium]|nr:CRTAC1 family protein [Myxococcales bacterium]